MSFTYDANAYTVGAATTEYCVDVTVNKTANGSVVNSVIHADGYSVPCAVKTTSPRSLQRSVEINY